MPARKAVIVALVSTVVLSGVVRAGDPLQKESLKIVGFSADGARFAVVSVEPGETKGTLKIWDVAKSSLDKSVPVDSAAPGADVLGPLGFGQDEGQENYKSGTSTSTRFALGGSPVEFQVKLKTKARSPAKVVLARGACKLSRDVPGRGSKYNLVAVRSSADGKSLAVVVKRTVDGCRRHAVVTAPIASGALAEPACLEGRCFAKLRQYIGNWYGDKETTDFEGGDTISEFSFSIGAKGPGQFDVGFGVDPGVGAIMMGAVTACDLEGRDISLTVGKEGDKEGGMLTLTRLGPNRLDVSADVMDWNASGGGRTTVMDQFTRSR